MTTGAAVPPAAQPAGVLRNFVFLSASAWGQQVLNFLTFFYLAGALGADVFGQVAFAQAVVLYFRLASDMGLDLFGARRVARNRAAVVEIVRDLVGARLMNAAVWGLVLIAAAAAIHQVRPVGGLILAFGLLLFPFAMSLEWAFSGLEQMEWVGVFRIVAAGAWFALVVGLVRGPDGVFVVPLANVAALSAASALLLAQFRRSHGGVGAAFRFDRWIWFVREAAPVGVSLLLIQVYVGFGVVALGLLDGERAAGLYAAPQRVVLFLTAISSMFGAALYPRLSALVQEAGERVDVLMSGAFRVMLMLGVPLGVGGALVAPSLIGLIYPPEYAPGIPVFRWLVLSVIPIFANVPFGFAVLAAGRRRAYLRAAAAGATVNVAVTLALIPSLHLLGPVVATLATETLVFAILLVESRHVGRVRAAAREVLSVGAATAVMAGAIVYAGRAPLLAQVLGGGAVYVAILVATGGLTRADLELLRAAAGSFRASRRSPYSPGG